MISDDQLKPLPGWVLCRPVRPTAQLGKLFIPMNMDTPVAEGVAQVVAVHELGRLRTAKGDSPETFNQDAVKVSDFILYRGFLKFANQVGEDLFLIHLGDVLAVLEDEGTIGYYGEFRIG